MNKFLKSPYTHCLYIVYTHPLLWFSNQAFPFHTRANCSWQIHQSPSLCQIQWGILRYLITQPLRSNNAVDHFLFLEFLSWLGFHIYTWKSPLLSFLPNECLFLWSFLWCFSSSSWHLILKHARAQFSIYTPCISNLIWPSCVLQSTGIDSLHCCWWKIALQSQLCITPNFQTATYRFLHDIATWITERQLKLKSKIQNHWSKPSQPISLWCSAS